MQQTLATLKQAMAEQAIDLANEKFDLYAGICAIAPATSCPPKSSGNATGPTATGS
jgi:hypothetical protein